MTTNQIAYWTLQETKRANLAKEDENVRSNQARERENTRTNLANELIKQQQADASTKQADIAGYNAITAEKAQAVKDYLAPTEYAKNVAAASKDSAQAKNYAAQAKVAEGTADQQIATTNMKNERAYWGIDNAENIQNNVLSKWLGNLFN